MTQEFIKKLEQADGTNRDEIQALFIDGFVDEVDIDENEFYCNGDTISFDDCSEEDFTFFKFQELDIDLWDVFEFVKTLKKVEKSLENLNSLNKLTMFVVGGEFQYDIDELHDIEEINKLLNQDVEVFELKKIK